MEGVLLRSKARWIADGEKITKYFCSLEKRNFISKRVTKLVKNDGNLTENPDEISNEINNFYAQLYKVNANIENCEISDLIKEIPQLSPEESKLLDGEITLEEAGYALKQMQNGKSPGTDGFGAEFFKFFWKQLGPFVIRALNEAFRDGELSTTQREGLITCIPKGDKPREYIKNWRPISLLNVIYKIGSSAIANRIKIVLPKLISEDQTGFVANRYMGDNIRLIYDLMYHLDLQKIPGMLLCLDFEKAFDSVDWKFMFKVLRAYGLGDDICRWIDTFYKNIKSTVTVNGHCTGWFKIERGCRQGDPISPYLFILCAEILAVMIREEKDIKGIYVSNVEHKISQFADDTQLLNNGDRTSFEKSIQLISKFAKVSGLYLNAEKTQAIWLGSKKHSKEKFMPNLKFTWNPEQFKILGIWFTKDLKECELKNYSEKFSEVQLLFKIWSKRSITPLGRIAVLKSLILSKLIHLWILLPNPPDDFVTRLQLLCYQFVWNTKQDRINRKIAVKNIKDGGLGIPDLTRYIVALKLTWLRKLEKTNHKWKSICINMYPFLNNLKCYGPCLVNTKNTGNRFWIHTLKAYKQFYAKIEPKTPEELLSEPVFFNNNILIGGKPIRQTRWIQNGVYCIAHFLNSNGMFLKHAEFKSMYNLNVDFVTYAGCVRSLQSYINKHNIEIKDNKSQNIPLPLKKLCMIQKGARYYYDILTATDIEPKCCLKWNQKLNCGIAWKNVFLKIQKIKDIKLKWLQIRIVHRIIATNIVLKEMGIVSSDRCSFCNEQRDSIEHFLWRCEHVKPFWSALEDMFREKYPLSCNMKFNEQFVIFGAASGLKTDIVTDFIIMLAKQYIFKCKMNSTCPRISLFMTELKHRYKIEEYNAKTRGDFPKFYQEWFFFSELVDPVADHN